ncbi:hypothetical protein C5B89_10885 [Haloferax sp. Atlit-47N]|nr:hypothetical protein C5B89_10885 [Haloferax sp. Atlit-47N]
MGRTRWDFDLAETAGAIAIALILVGLLLRNLVDATTSADVVRAFGGVTILALLFGYRFVSHRLDEQASGVLLLFVGGLVAGLTLLVAPSAFADRGTIAAFAALGVLATAFIVSPWISVSTRWFGALLCVIALLMAGLELTVFTGEDIGSAIVVAMLGLVMVLRPKAIEETGGRTE